MLANAKTWITSTVCFVCISHYSISTCIEAVSNNNPWPSTNGIPTSEMIIHRVIVQVDRALVCEGWEGHQIPQHAARKICSVNNDQGRLPILLHRCRLMLWPWACNSMCSPKRWLDLWGEGTYIKNAKEAAEIHYLPVTISHSPQRVPPGEKTCTARESMPRTWWFRWSATNRLLGTSERLVLSLRFWPLVWIRGWWKFEQWILSPVRTGRKRWGCKSHYHVSCCREMPMW